MTFHNSFEASSGCYAHHLLFPGISVARIVASEISLFGTLRQVGMSMIWAATPVMEAEGNARSQDKNWIITWSNLGKYRAYADAIEE